MSLSSSQKESALDEALRICLRDNGTANKAPSIVTLGSHRYGPMILPRYRDDARKIGKSSVKTKTGSAKIPGKECGRGYISAAYRCGEHYTNGKLNDKGKAAAGRLSNKVRLIKGLSAKDLLNSENNTSKLSPSKRKADSAKEFIKNGKQIVSKALEGFEDSAYKEALKIRDEAKNAVLKNPTDQKLAKNFLTADKILSARKDLADLRSFEKLRNQLLSKGDAQTAKDWIDYEGVVIADNTKPLRPDGAIRADLEEFHQLTRGKIEKTLKTVAYTKFRASASLDQKLLNIGFNFGENRSKEVLFHEAGHLLESGDKRYSKAAAEWRRSRSSSPEAKRLKDIDKTFRGDDDEVALEGNYIHPYIGKIYATLEGERHEVTEVISVGLEHFATFRGMRDLYRKDPEMFELVVGILDD